MRAGSEALNTADAPSPSTGNTSGGDHARTPDTGLGPALWTHKRYPIRRRTRENELPGRARGGMVRVSGVLRP